MIQTLQISDGAVVRNYETTELLNGTGANRVGSNPPSGKLTSASIRQFRKGKVTDPYGNKKAVVTLGLSVPGESGAADLAITANLTFTVDNGLRTDGASFSFLMAQIHNLTSSDALLARIKDGEF